jgi:hypothetical protein
MPLPQTDLPTIEFDLSYGGIEAVDIKGEGRAGPQPVDVIAIGHYRGVRSSGAERDLDVQISKALFGRSWKPAEGGVLTQFSDHAVLPGDLGQVFFLPDPRAPDQRLIAIAGMGPPGRFGVPELTLLVQQLCWTLGLLGKHHLATTLIGSGTGNLSLSDAIYAWTRGIRAAITGRPSRTLEKITFVNINPGKIIEIDYAIRHEQAYLKTAERGLEIHYCPIDEKRQDQLATASVNQEERKLKQRLARRLAQMRNPSSREDQDLDDVAATRLTIEFDAQVGYQFGVITEDAAIPMRATLIGKELILRANQELEDAEQFTDQLDRGRFLSELLLPNDLASALMTNAPIVMALDTDTAQIHWEMLALDPIGAVSHDETDAASAPAEYAEEDLMRFLGTSRGFTRQLRTATASLDLPPPRQRTLRVLVIGDPAEDAPLAGAANEAALVADLFEQYNQAPAKKDADPGNRVDVVRLFGPQAATRTNVLRELMNKRYDVLHFAGHCQFNRKHPTKSGWLFRCSPEEYISANELRRIDRIPKFIFSNACESGVMPDRDAPISKGLGPTFAESFFNQGVTNFICTAWKVDDDAAKVFASEFYASLLGLQLDAGGDKVVSRGKPEPIVTALRRARRATAASPTGARTWGAYQHYGNPYYAFFARSAWSDDDR